jgi:hypothetical protein
MKKSITVGILMFQILCCWSLDKKVLPVSQEKFSINSRNKELGYQLTDSGNTVVFVFNPASYKVNNVDKVFVEGSFNGWAKGTDESWVMTKTKGSVWTLSKTKEQVSVPGNSGFPEFKFYIFSNGKKTAEEPAAISKIPGYQMATNNLVLFLGDNPDIVIENAKTANIVKKLADFNLDDPAQVAIISNVRKVPGTTMLWRGYHPYKKSRGQYDTEDTRIALVNKQLQANGIQSIITLSGDEKISEAQGEQISSYQQAIIDAGNNLFVDTSYNVVYYHSAESDFGNVVKTIVLFINTHPAPYYIHCRLGTDRTGVLSAVLAALSGASWKDIAEDYQKTNELGIKEFRDYRLLQYSFEKMLGKPFDEVTDLKQELGAHFIAGGYLTQPDLDTLCEKLTK